MMKSFSIVILATLLPQLFFAQSSKMGHKPDHFDPDHHAELRYPDINLHSASPEEISQILTSRVFNHQAKRATFSLNTERTSPFAKHYLFDQTFGGIRVYNGQVKLNVARDGSVLSLMDASYETEDWPINVILNQSESIHSRELAKDFITANYAQDEVDFSYEKVVLKKAETSPVVALAVTVSIPSRMIYRKHVIDQAQNVLLTKDLNSYAQKDTTATGSVFLPDPLTTAGVRYGPPFIDAGDSDRTVLNSERILVDFPVTEQNNQFHLKNDFVKLLDFSNPSVPPATSNLPFFNFTRSQPGFEDVNVVYHISRFKQFIDSLGFTSLVNFPIHVDPHALNGSDNSVFSPSTDTPRISFGEGGVDDAEDADVIIHEYGHAISYSASPNTNNGNERMAIEEGFCDYFSASYSYAIDSFNWHRVFSWDGHNEFWPGRLANTSKVYPANFNPGASIHQNGEIFSSTLMDLFFRVGRNVTTSLFLQSLFSYSSNMTMPQAGLLLLQADSLLYDGDHYCQIYPVLSQRGLIQSAPLDSCQMKDDSMFVSAGRDVEVCNGQSTTIGGSPTAKTSNASYQWQPAKGLSNPRSPNPVVSVDTTTTYRVFVRKSNDRFNVDHVQVKVVNCVDDINILNITGFSKGRSPLIIQFPQDTKHSTVRLYDALGRFVKNIDHRSNENLEISSTGLFKGVYFISIKTKQSEVTETLVKF